MSSLSLGFGLSGQFISIGDIAIAGPEAYMLPDGSFELTLTDTTATLVISTPPELAGTYVFEPQELAAGPVNLVPPGLNGIGAAGESLSLTPGLWVYDGNNSAPSIAFRWQSAPEGTTAFADIAGQTAPTYAVTSVDEGTNLRAVETLTGTNGTRSAASSTLNVPETVSGFDPSALFASGEVGIWLDPSDLSSMWQDSAQTVPVSADGDPVGFIIDKSGNDNHFHQTSSSRRMAYRTDGTRHWLEGDGSDDGLEMVNTFATATSTMFWGASIETSDNTFILVPTNNNNIFAGAAQSGSGLASALGMGTPTYRAAGTDVTVTTRSGLHTAWGDGVAKTAVIQNLSIPATGRLFLGRYGVSGSFSMTGRLYSTICRSALSAQELANTEAYLEGLF